MSRSCIGLRISLLFFFLPFIGFSQTPVFDTAGFYKHLVKENLLPEQVAFCNQLLKTKPNSIIKDSITLNLALAYHKLGNDNLAYNNLLKLPLKPMASEFSTRLYLSLLVSGKEWGRADTFLFSNRPSMELTYYRELNTSLEILERKPTKQDTNISGYSSAMADIKYRYENEPGHSAFLAGMLSAVIPGLGKYYMGYKQEALSAFVGDALLGAQAAESYIKSGPRSARFILSGSLFGVFYGGNIWGSILLAKKQKRDYKKQLDYEIHNYFNTLIADGSH